MRKLIAVLVSGVIVGCGGAPGGPVDPEPVVTVSPDAGGEPEPAPAPTVTTTRDAGPAPAVSDAAEAATPTPDAGEAYDHRAFSQACACADSFAGNECALYPGHTVSIVGCWKALSPSAATTAECAAITHNGALVPDAPLPGCVPGPESPSRYVWCCER